MLGILTDDTAYHLPFAIASNDEVAILANLLDGSANFHEEEEEESP